MNNQSASLQDRVQRIVNYSLKLKSERDTAMVNLKSFSQKLYAELERVLMIAEKNGLGWSCGVKRYKAFLELEAFLFQWDERNIIFLPAHRAALPKANANLSLAKQHGCIVVYATFDIDQIPATPYGEIYISSDGKWTTLGLPPYNHVDQVLEDGDITEFAVALLESLTFMSRVSFKDPEEELLTEEIIKTKSPIGFAIPPLNK